MLARCNLSVFGAILASLMMFALPSAANTLCRAPALCLKVDAPEDGLQYKVSVTERGKMLGDGFANDYHFRLGVTDTATNQSQWLGLSFKRRAKDCVFHGCIRGYETEFDASAIGSSGRVRILFGRRNGDQLPVLIRVYNSEGVAVSTEGILQAP